MCYAIKNSRDILRLHLLITLSIYAKHLINNVYIILARVVLLSNKNILLQ